MCGCPEMTLCAVDGMLKSENCQCVARQNQFKHSVIAEIHAYHHGFTIFIPENQ